MRVTVIPTVVDALGTVPKGLKRGLELMEFGGRGELAEEKSLVMVKIQRRIFQRDALSLLIFIIAMKPLNRILRKCPGGYKLTKSKENINHLMHGDDIKQFVKKEKY